MSIHVSNRLRGCIGAVEPVRSLRETLISCAVAAATQDLRFPGLTVEEMPVAKFEISVLSPIKEIESPEEVEVGRHGLMVEMGPHRGLLLPQVAIHHGWDRSTFLEQTCLKAGLPAEAWRGQARIGTFTAEVFGEA